MKKFIVIYHSTPEANKEMAAATPKQQAKGMDAWMKWGAKCGAQLVAMGAPLVGGLAVALDGTSKKSRKNVSGYSILQADSMDNAKKLLKGHPHLKANAGCTLEINEVMPMPTM